MPKSSRSNIHSSALTASTQSAPTVPAQAPPALVTSVALAQARSSALNWSAAWAIAQIMVGCVANTFSLEIIAKYDRGAGHLVTLVQFTFISIACFIFHYRGQPWARAMSLPPRYRMFIVRIRASASPRKIVNLTLFSLGQQVVLDAGRRVLPFISRQ